MAVAIDPYKITIPPLPTLDNLNATVPENVDVHKVALDWLNSLAAAIDLNELERLHALFVEDSWWRDMLALTWDFRTFRGLADITTFLKHQIGLARPRAFKLRQDYLSLDRPGEDLAWIRAVFDFETETGLGLGVFHLVPTPSGDWKGLAMYTNLEDLKGFPENIGALRSLDSNHQWEDDRKRERAFEATNPVVLIIGGGHNGLGLAARLKSLGVSALIIERNQRIGDNWRKRYEAMCLHDVVWYDHMPYLPFPPTWPVFSPARKLANWLENYAEAMDLNVWTSTNVEKASQDAISKHWSVTVKRMDGTNRVFNVKHVVFATGFEGVEPKIPKFSGVERFRGQVLHTTQYVKASDYAGKKVVVIGACTAGHDVAEDCYNHGLDVTMLQRGPTYVVSVKNLATLFLAAYSENGPPTDMADRFSAALPNFLGFAFSQRMVKYAAYLDKDILDALHARGFKTDLGIQGTGIILSAFSKAGGYYLDVGASRLVADGKIKLKSDSLIKEFTETGIVFEDGSKLSADVIVYATGITNAKSHISKICGDGIADQCSPIFEFNEEGEVLSAGRELGVPGLWYMFGHMAMARFHSKHVAMQIKAMEEGVFGERYSLA